jgi:YHS domain-containing protein/predicted small lipoprotein YifL
MRNVFYVLVVLAGLMTLAGCEKKTEPTTNPAMDMSKPVKEVTDQAKQTAADTQKTAQATVAAATEQTVCPVMAGNPIDKNIFVEYKGKKVYFCCESCKADFNKDPEKYIKDLPQFKQ